MVLPIIEELAEEVTDVKICKVNVDEQMKIAKEYRVMSIPTLILFKDGKIAKQELGAKTKEEVTGNDPWISARRTKAETMQKI